jgi:hypothetical protein
MAMNNLAKIGRWALELSPLVIVPAALVAAQPWLNQQNDAISKGSAVAASIFVMGYSLFLAARVNRRLDEVEIAGQRFAQTKGMTYGCFIAVLVMMFPPSMNALVDLANSIGAGSPDKAVKLAISIGFMLVVLSQLLAMLAVATWWGRRLGRSA